MEKNNKNIDIWSLTPNERMAVINERKRNSKFIVYDYARSIDGGNERFGAICELGRFIDSGFVHGFVVSSVENGLSLSSKWTEISVYSKAYPLDEEFENRTEYPYHVFSSLSKAEEYSKKCRAHCLRYGLDKPTFDDVLSVVRKYDASFSIGRGKRSVDFGDEYEAICNGTTTIFRVSDVGEVLMLRGQMLDSYVFPHIDLLDLGLEFFYGKGSNLGSEDLNSAMRLYGFVS